MPGVFHATQKDKAAWACDSNFNFVVEVKVFAYLLNVTQRFVMRIVSYGNVFHMHATISVGYGWSVPKLLSGWVYGAALVRKEKTFEVSKECSAVCS
jgi:hypothetical protein